MPERSIRVGWSRANWNLTGSMT